MKEKNTLLLYVKRIDFTLPAALKKTFFKFEWFDRLTLDASVSLPQDMEILRTLHLIDYLQ